MTAVPPSYQQYQPPPQQPAQKSSGCVKWSLIGCGVVLVLVLGFAGLIVATVFGTLRASEAYRHARDRAANDPRVVAVLGAPVEGSFWVTGNLRTNNGTGAANIHFWIHGPRGKAGVDADATLENGSWVYSRILVHPDRGGDIDVLHP